MKYNKLEMEIIEFEEGVLTDIEMTSGDVGWENPNIPVSESTNIGIN